MPTFYNFRENGVDYSFGDIFVPADLFRDGNLYIWGSNFSQKLGVNDNTSRSTPVTTFAGGASWKQVSAGFRHSAAIKNDGTLWVWGRNSYGQLGTNDTGQKNTPTTTFAGGTNWKQVDCGGYHTAAIKTDGTLWTWGHNGNTNSSKGPGQLGTNDTTNRSTPVTTFAGGTNWKQVSCNKYNVEFTTAIKTDGTLWTWGNGSSGQLGIGGEPALLRITPVTTFAGGTNWADTATGAADELYTISAGGANSAAVKTDGTLWIWGNNYSGQIGNADAGPGKVVSTPVTTFAGGTDWKQVSSGPRQTTAIKTDGTLWVWGSGTYGILGVPDYSDRFRQSTPITTFAGGTNWKQVSTAAESLILAVKTDGTLWNWGQGNFGYFGRGTSIRNTPVTTFAGGTNWADTATGAADELYTISAGGTNSGAIKTDGTLWIWGGNYDVSLGNNSQLFSATPITTFAGGTNWKQISVGRIRISSNAEPFAGAIKTDGTLWTWGYSSFGRLGTAGGNASTPVTTFAGGSDWKQLSCGGYHAAAVKTDGTLYVWGRNFLCELGTNDRTTRTIPVTTFAGGTDWSQVSCGSDYSTTAVKTDGTLWVWGNNGNGQLGTNDYTNRSTPVTTFAGGTDWKQVFIGRVSTAAVKTDGTLWAWGQNGNGQLGTNDTNIKNTPVTTFAGGTNWKQVSIGTNDHTAAIKTDGTLWIWGRAANGRLGTNDTTPDRSTPVTTFAGGTDWKQVDCGFSQTIALKDDGVNKELYVWGDDKAVNQSKDIGPLGINLDSTRLPSQVFGNSSDWNHAKVSNNSSAAIKTDGTLWTWGNNSTGQLGTNDLTYRSTPVTTFAGGTNWKQVSSGTHTAAVKTDGTLWVWGNNGNGQLGTNDYTNRSTPVTTFAGGTDWKQVTITSANTAAVKTDGTLWTWGFGFGGLLGTNDTTPNRSTPVTTFAGGTDWKQVSGNDSTSDLIIALKDDGVNKELYVWGNRSLGRLGINDVAFSTPTQEITLSNDWKQVSAGGYHTSAVKTDGTLWVWGAGNFRQLAQGYGDNSNKFTPVTTFAGGTNWKQASAGFRHSAAIKNDGTLWTWGSNGYAGALGNNQSGSLRATPITTFAGGNNWKQVSAGNFHTAAIKTDGTLWTWGNNSTGQLGTNDLTIRVTPVTTFAGGSSWKQLSSAHDHVLASTYIDPVL